MALVSNKYTLLSHLCPSLPSYILSFYLSCLLLPRFLFLASSLCSHLTVTFPIPLLQLLSSPIHPFSPPGDEQQAGHRQHGRCLLHAAGGHGPQPPGICLGASGVLETTALCEAIWWDGLPPGSQQGENGQKRHQTPQPASWFIGTQFDYTSTNEICNTCIS